MMSLAPAEVQKATLPDDRLQREAVKSLEMPMVGPRLISTATSKGRQSETKTENPLSVGA
jgi:hypothetical protein